MNFKSCRLNVITALAAGLWIFSLATASAQAPRDGIECLRSDLRTDRKVVIAQEMNFSEAESNAFWPIYRNYRSEVEKATDRVVELILQYADLYPDVPEAKAREMLQAYSKVEADLLGIKRKYLKKFGKVLPPSKVFRFAQLDNRLDLGTRVALATSIPLMPQGQSQANSQSH